MFCSKCGAKIQDGSKFCSECGAAVVSNSQIVQNEERKKEFIGNVRKCPVCGEEITSFTAICPACGHELNSAKVSDTLTKFIEQVKTCEDVINEQDIPAAGWASWGKNQRIWWVVANVFLLGMPIAVTFILPFITRKMPKLTKEEKQLSSLIENFPFPNDRESILEAIVYAKEKIDFISKQNVTSKSAYWMGLWCSKAEQLKQKADLMFPNDLVVKQSYAEILDDKKRVNGVIRNKAIIGAVILVVVLGYCYISNRTESTTINYNAEFEWKTNGLFSYLPEPQKNKGKINSETEERIHIELYDVKQEDFEDYVKACIEMGFTISTTKTDSVYYAYNAEQYELDIFYWEEKEAMEIFLDAPMEMVEIRWPDNKMVKQIPQPESLIGKIMWENSEHFGVYIANTTPEQYSEYVERCINAGFTEDYSRGEKTFHAYNKDGYYLVVEQHLFDEIYISIKERENDK